MAVVARQFIVVCCSSQDICCGSETSPGARANDFMLRNEATKGNSEVEIVIHVHVRHSAGCWKAHSSLGSIPRISAKSWKNHQKISRSPSYQLNRVESRRKYCRESTSAVGFLAVNSPFREAEAPPTANCRWIEASIVARHPGCHHSSTLSLSVSAQVPSH